ncbi:purine-nucleoside phosphorylase [Shouchella lonarensis]|uniref:Purine nucleoside phosphorylase n=2 Tax=Shouchella lonarensis TaxID=1464122 RepID=A0A1G6LHN0_9BACI|nr:purine-nucleoside phosphorylase [Shouchella lonarensis]
MTMKTKVQEAAEAIQAKLTVKPRVGLILGSGLGVLAEEIAEAVKLPYETLPHFPVSTVSGHAGQLVAGKLQGKDVIAMQGRFHYYEGYSMQEVTFPVRVMKALGVTHMLVTNAAGGVNKAFNVGDLMLITDHINLMGDNPLMGKNEDDFGPRFPDMSEAYSHTLRTLAQGKADELGLKLQEGVYVGNSGPTYETPAEVRMARTLGGDAVGMSTVPEVIVARHTGLEVLGISCITNMAAGVLPQPLSHEEVIETTEMVRADFLALVKAIVGEMV